MKQQLFTNFNIPSHEILSISKPFLFEGSCFSENISSKFIELRINAKPSTFGTVFNPISLNSGLTKLIEGSELEEAELIYLDEGKITSIYHSGLGIFNSKSEIQQWFYEQHCKYLESVKSAGTLVITYGSTHGYFLNSNSQLVANCHKLPNHLFSKKLIEIDEISSSIQNLVEVYLNINPALNIIFTVSPVKYLKDGLMENNLSKSTLLLALHKVMSNSPNERITYFPAFEILQDELRDHQFYAEDNAHPSAWTIKYIFKRFCETYFNANNKAILEDLQSYYQLANHRILDKDKENEWIKKLESTRIELTTKYPFLGNK